MRLSSSPWTSLLNAPMMLIQLFVHLSLNMLLLFVPRKSTSISFSLSSRNQTDLLYEVPSSYLGSRKEMRAHLVASPRFQWLYSVK